MTTVTSFVPVPTSPTNTTSTPQNGITGGYPGHNQVILRAMTAFAAISWYNAIELIILVLLRFKRKVGLYFWSMLITAASIIIYQVGAWGKMMQITHTSLVVITFLNVGWIIMVVGQSIVLYSRLHLITQNRTLLNAVLWMIIINSTLMYIPTTALTFGSNVATGASFDAYFHGYEKMERIQMTFFTVQELIISGVYLWEASRYLKMIMENNIRKLMWELFMVNVALVILDVVLLSVEYKNLYQIEVTLKGMVYSIKLKLELGVLSKLVKLVTERNDSHVVHCQDDQNVNVAQFASPKCAKNILRSSDELPQSPCSQDSKTNLAFGAMHVDYAEKQPTSRNGAPLTGPSDAIPTGAHLPALPPQASKRSSVADMYPGKLC